MVLGIAGAALVYEYRGSWLGLGGAEVDTPGESEPAGSTPATSEAAETGSEQPAQEFHGELISLDLEEADLADVMRYFSEITGLNIVLASDLQGIKVTVRMIDVPWDEALVTILAGNGLEYELRGSTMLIRRAD